VQYALGSSCALRGCVPELQYLLDTLLPHFRRTCTVANGDVLELIRSQYGGSSFFHFPLGRNKSFGCDEQREASRENSGKGTFDTGVRKGEGLVESASQSLNSGE